jgi:predicted Zn-dependent protease
VTAARRLGAGLWPLLLLAAFLGTFRRPVTQAGGASLAACDPASASVTGDDLAAVERCLELDPSNASLLIDVARRIDAAGRRADAERLYVRALDIDPSNSDLHVRMGELLMDRGDAEGARREAEAALRWRPNGAAGKRLLERVTAARTP